MPHGFSRQIALVAASLAAMTSAHGDAAGTVGGTDDQPIITERPDAVTPRSDKTQPPLLDDRKALPISGRLPSTFPPFFQAMYRKFGQWDYKQESFEYRDFTHYNYGATGAAGGFSSQQLMEMARAARPTPDDLDRLDSPDLATFFNANVKNFERLREIADQDVHFIRVAADYTWLDNNKKWPRDDLGFGEARWNEYKSLFEKLSLAEGMVRTRDFPGATFFIARAYGLCTGGSSSGFVYSAKPFAPTSDFPLKTLNVEARNNPKRHYAYAFKSLKPNWYAFYELDW